LPHSYFSKILTFCISPFRLLTSCPRFLKTLLILPCNYTANSMSGHRLQSLALSYRGAERKPPTILRLSHTFQRNALVLAGVLTEQSLDLAISKFNLLPDVKGQFEITYARATSIKNIVLKVSDEVKDEMLTHINNSDPDGLAWSDSVLLRKRWLLGGISPAAPAGNRDQTRRLTQHEPL
jgi:hypothetical protein